MTEYEDFEEARAEIALLIQQIKANLDPGMRVVIIARCPGDEEREFMAGDDDPIELVEVMKRMATRERV